MENKTCIVLFFKIFILIMKVSRHGGRKGKVGQNAWESALEREWWEKGDGEGKRRKREEYHPLTPCLDCLHMAEFGPRFP
jgi:hypothetical protein